MRGGERLNCRHVLSRFQGFAKHRRFPSTQPFADSHHVRCSWRELLRELEVKFLRQLDFCIDLFITVFPGDITTVARDSIILPRQKEDEPDFL